MTNPNTVADTDVIRRHVEAVVKMLLPARRIKPSLVLMAGDTLNPEGRIELCSMAADTDTDLVHLEFETVDGEYRMTGINIAVPRDGKVYFFGGCQLSIPAGAKRAVLMPRDARQGHFVVAPREVMHFKTKPRAALEEGRRRAQDRLTQLLDRDLDVRAQGHTHQIIESA